MTHESYVMKHCKLFFPRVVGLIDPQPVSTADNKGFTLIELILVVAILVILAAMSIPSYNSYMNKVKITGATADIRTMSTEITAFYIDSGTYPINLSGIKRGGFLDPWGNTYVYKQIPILMDKPNFDTLNTDYDIFSTGSTGDGVGVAAGGDPANDDDIVRSNDGSFIGLRP